MTPCGMGRLRLEPGRVKRGDARKADQKRNVVVVAVERHDIALEAGTNEMAVYYP